MPIYEYECTECGHRLETIQKVTEAPLADCPTCGKIAALKRLISAAGFHLKGGGWYATDFKNSGKKSESKSDTNKSDTKGDKGGGGSGSDGATASEGAAPEKKAHSCGDGCTH